MTTFEQVWRFLMGFLVGFGVRQLLLQRHNVKRRRAHMDDKA